MYIHIEICAFSAGQAHGAIWLDNGTAIPISMPIEGYETALANGLFLRLGDQEDLYPDTNGVMNESHIFSTHESRKYFREGEWRFQNDVE